VARPVHCDGSAVLVADALVESILVDGGQVDGLEIEHHAAIVLGELHDQLAESLAAVPLVHHHGLHKAGLLLRGDRAELEVGDHTAHALGGQHQAAGQGVAGGLQGAHARRFRTRPLGVDQGASVLHQLRVVVDGHHVKRTAADIEWW